jgi:Polyketide cyclase / dehydrase and lipid transport
MAGANDYSLVTRWRFKASAAQVFAFISRPEDFPRWWGSVYKKAQQMDAGSEQGIGRVIRFRTKGFLPFRRRWEVRITEAVPPTRIAMLTTGNMAARGLWLLEEEGGITDVMFEWRLTARKPLLRFVSTLFRPLFKPLFRANHRWAMEQGRRGLEKELGRLVAISPQQPTPKPPQPDLQRPDLQRPNSKQSAAGG